MKSRIKYEYFRTGFINRTTRPCRYRFMLCECTINTWIARSVLLFTSAVRINCAITAMWRKQPGRDQIAMESLKNHRSSDSANLE